MFKYLSGIYRQNYNLEFQPFIDCPSCTLLTNKHVSESPYFDEELNVLQFKNQTYKVGYGVMLTPGSFEIESRQRKGFRNAQKKEQKDPNVYTEYWRKSEIKTYKVRGNTENISDPFDIGIIEKIYKKVNGKVMIKVQCLYRPENTTMSWKEVIQQDFSKLYWTDQTASVDALNIEGKVQIFKLLNNFLLFKIVRTFLG